MKTHKVCAACKELKPKDEYYFNRTRKCLSSKCKDCLKKYVSEYQKSRKHVVGSSTWWCRKYSRIKHRAKKRNIAFVLTQAEFRAIIAKGQCSYCGLVHPMMTVDRVDSAGIYEVSNCVTACFMCNVSKTDMNVDKWRDLQ